MNMAINKVIYGGNALIDLTGDDVTAAALYEGVKAHDKSGAQITGTNPYNAANVDPAVTSALAALTEKGVDTTGKWLADIAGLVSAIESGGGSVQFHMQTWTPAEDVSMGNIQHGAGFAPNIALVLSPSGWSYYGDGTRTNAVGIAVSIDKSVISKLNIGSTYGRKAFMSFNSYNGAVGSVNPTLTETYIDTALGTGNKYYAGQTYLLFLVKVE